MFEVYVDQILSFNTVDEFAIWFDMMHEFIEIENVDDLLSELAVMDKPDFYMYVYDFKQTKLKNEQESS